MKREAQMPDKASYDYIVVGAGSAGCVVASRLSERAGNTVLLLEAGPEDNSYWMKVPAGMTRLFSPSATNWGYFTEPEPHLRDRKIYWPRGKTLGGSSSINGMLYMRGHPEDYDVWTQLGARGWGWDEVLPYFRKAEDHAHGDSPLHGIGGPLAVTDLPIDDEGARLFMQAAEARGLPYRRDLNDGIQEGVGRPQVTVRDGRRASTSAAYLRPARHRANLHVEVGALAERVAFEGRRAVGVRYRQGGRTIEVRARREVILAGGVVNSPQLLMLSGIGDAEHLAEHGIPVVHHLRGVGRNLQDHAYVYYIAEVSRHLSVNHHLRGGFRLAYNAMRYMIARSGYLNIGACQATAFPRVAPGATRPDVEISFRPMSWDIVDGAVRLHDFPGMNASCSLLRPQARGRISLASSDPATYPKIQANYFDNMTDLMVMREGMRWIRQVFQASPLAEHVKREVLPGLAVETDQDWEDYIRDTAQSVYHPVGTCQIGMGDDAVVDPDLRVRGITGLRVIDASVMPRITSSNTNAPTIMVAEKGADLILSGLAIAQAA